MHHRPGTIRIHLTTPFVLSSSKTPSHKPILIHRALRRKSMPFKASKSFKALDYLKVVLPQPRRGDIGFRNCTQTASLMRPTLTLPPRSTKLLANPSSGLRIMTTRAAAAREAEFLASSTSDMATQSTKKDALRPQTSPGGISQAKAPGATKTATKRAIRHENGNPSPSSRKRKRGAPIKEDVSQDWNELPHNMGLIKPTNSDKVRYSRLT